jgi:hypothetical protein
MDRNGGNGDGIAGESGNRPSGDPSSGRVVPAKPGGLEAAAVRRNALAGGLCVKPVAE